MIVALVILALVVGAVVESERRASRIAQPATLTRSQRRAFMRERLDINPALRSRR